MSEEFYVLNPDQVEGGIEIPSEVYDAILIVADNIDSIKIIADQIDETGSILVTKVDGVDTEIQVNRNTSAGWSAANPILALGEFGYVTDTVNPYVLKIGDGLTSWLLLPNILLTSELTKDYLDGVVAQVQTAAAQAQTSATAAETSRSQAATSAVEANLHSEIAADWAVAPVTAPLPGGKFSAEANATIAAQNAAISRYILKASMSGSETAAAGHLFQKRIFNGGSLAVVTVPPNLYTSADAAEAWTIYRKEGAGNIQFVASTAGSGLTVPTLAASTRSGIRNKTPATDVTVTAVFPIAVPAVTDGKLTIAVFGSSGDSRPKTLTLSLDHGLTSVSVKAFLHAAINVSDVQIFEAPLLAFAAATVNATVIYGGDVNRVHIFASVIDGHGGPGVFFSKIDATAASGSLVLSAVPASSRIFACTDMTGAAGGTAPLSFSSFGASISRISSGNSANDPDLTASDTTVIRNCAWAYGSASPSVAGDVTVNVNYSASASRPVIVAWYYPPKVTPGSGTLTLNKMDGRDTLSVAYGEAVLLYGNDGLTATLLTPKP